MSVLFLSGCSANANPVDNRVYNVCYTASRVPWYYLSIIQSPALVYIIIIFTLRVRNCIFLDNSHTLPSLVVVGHSLWVHTLSPHSL